MSTWRGKALELFPEMRESFLDARDYKAVWSELERGFRAAVASRDNGFAARFFKYASWSLSPSPQTRTVPEVSQGAAEIFYEFADELHRWIDRYDFMKAQKSLRYYLGEQRYDEFEHRFLDRTKGYVKRRRRKGISA